MRSYRRTSESIPSTSTPAKDILLLCAILVCFQLYVNHPAKKEVEAAPQPAPQRAEKPRLYYHSPLEAPAMEATAYTGLGYFSTDPDARFELKGNTGPKAVSTAQALNWGDESESQTIKALQSVYKLP